jgi:hypothetical protein
MTQHEGRERDRFSLIGHAALPFLCPLREDELVSILDRAGLAASGASLDLGGGRADLSILLARRYGMRAVSVDRSAQATEAARERVGTLEVTLVTRDAESHLATIGDRSLAFASCLGAVHCFGVRRQGWQRTTEALARVAPRVLVGDLVARSDEAADAFELARLDTLDALLAQRAIARTVLDASRVHAYERAWCSSVAAHVAAHPNDPRNAWARARLAWADDPSLTAARAALAFVTYLL